MPDSQRTAPFHVDSVNEARLLVVDGGVSWEVPLGKAARELTIGRRQDCAIRLDDTSASRAHAMLRVAEGGHIFLRDLRSANGTFVNGERIDAEVPLVGGDAAQIGGAMLHLMRQPASVAHDVHDAHDANDANDPIVPARRRAKNERTIAVAGQPVLVADEQMARAYALLEQLASSNVSILLAGETGVGKEVAARLVHERSPRRDGPFIAVNCSAIAEGLAESELFGSARGAFTNAYQARVGFIEAAHGGTLFLDEIGELRPATQATLLRVLETRSVVRLGETKARAVDIGLVAATHRNLEDEVRAGRFREDLFFRVVGAQVELPPLRRRPSEILPLAEAFLAASFAPRRVPELQEGTREILLRHPWPGNVRELLSAMRYVAGVCSGRSVGPEHLPARLQAATTTAAVLGRTAETEVPSPLAHAPHPMRAALPTLPVVAMSIGEEVRALEEKRIREALASTGGNKTRAATLIGMPLRTLTEKMKQYGIARSE